MLNDYVLKSETDVLKAIQLETATLGYHFWRNNSGAMFNPHGRFVRFGLGNESAEINEKMKSSDLIGIGPGGKFWAVEAKEPGWVYNPRDETERAQFCFLTIVSISGGIGMFATHPDQVIEQIKKEIARLDVQPNSLATY